MGGFRVSTDELRAHANAVENVAADVDDAASAAAAERAGGLVYGVLFDAIAQPFLNLWADHLHDVVAGNATLGHAVAGGIRANADTYDGIEHATTRRVTRSGDGVR